MAKQATIMIKLVSTAIVESSQDAIVGTTLGGVITSWNAGATRLFGYGEAQALGKPAALIVPPDRADEADRVVRALKAGESIPPFESVRRSQDGRHIPVSVAISLVKREDGEVAAYAFRDISELTRSRESLRDEARRKDEFLALLSHELRNPLAPLRNCVEILRSKPEAEGQAAGMLEMIDRQTAQLTMLVDQLLDASRISTGKIGLRRQVVDLVELVRATVEDYRASLENAGLALELQLSGQPLWVDADPGRIAQVVANLLTNSRKFTPIGGLVIISVEAESGEERAAVSVRDTGSGMDLEQLGRLFAAFPHPGRGVVRAGGGLGLGLALVKSLVDSHGGSVQAWSDGPGTGSVVTFRLPLYAGTLAPAVEPASRSKEATSQPRRILILEDNVDAGTTTKMLLELAGHEAKIVDDARKALDEARSFRPDVVLCDIGLPGPMDGYAVATAFRSDPSLGSTYLVALTGYGQEADRERARKAGFNVHLTKPADPTALRRLVARVPRTS